MPGESFAKQLRVPMLKRCYQGFRLSSNAIDYCRTGKKCQQHSDIIFANEKERLQPVLFAQFSGPGRRP